MALLGRVLTRQIFTVSRRGGDRKPAVRVVLDALAAEAARPLATPLEAAVRSDGGDGRITEVIRKG